MNEILQAVTKLIENGLDWQETIVFGLSVITFGFIIWVIVMGIIKISDSVVKTIVEATVNILLSIFRGFKNVVSSLTNISSVNQPPKI